MPSIFTKEKCMTIGSCEHVCNKCIYWRACWAYYKHDVCSPTVKIIVFQAIDLGKRKMNDCLLLFCCCCFVSLKDICQVYWESATGFCHIIYMCWGVCWAYYKHGVCSPLSMIIIFQPIDLGSTPDKSCCCFVSFNDKCQVYWESRVNWISL